MHGNSKMYEFILFISNPIQLKNIASILFISILFFSCSTTTYYLVRHAEKADSSSDPTLSSAGIVRANALKDVLSSKNISSIYVTNYQRTQQTAAPLATASGITPTIITASSTSTLIAALRTTKGNRRVLVVGHSNTVPQVIDSLMKSPQHILIADDDFDNFYIVSIRHGLSTKKKLDSMTYGMKSP
jgi:broad specificity phosphatase PhoE